MVEDRRYFGTLPDEPGVGSRLVVLASLIGDVMSDGGLYRITRPQRTMGGSIAASGSYRVFFSSKDPAAIERFNNDCLVFFDRWPAPAHPNARGVLRCQLYSRDAWQFLRFVGVPVGAKAQQGYGVPEIIYHSEHTKRAFLSRFFDAEASVRADRREISISQSKREGLISNGLQFMNELRGLLADLGVRTSQPWPEQRAYYVGKDGTGSYRIAFSIGPNDIASFHQRVGFGDRRKRQEVLKWL